MRDMELRSIRAGGVRVRAADERPASQTRPFNFGSRRRSAPSASGLAGAARAAQPAGRAMRGRGATTPIEMMYLSASSTVMSSSRTDEVGTITK